jgi:hypothetical protein
MQPGRMEQPLSMPRDRDGSAQFEAHRELIEAIASAEFDRISNKETRLVRIFAKHIPSPTQK